MMESHGQLCARARFWASLRADDELSELEGALLDAHVARCADCAEFLAGTAAVTRALRAQPLLAHAPVSLPVRPAPHRTALLGVAAAAVVIGAALLGGLVDNAGSGPATTEATKAQVVGVASVETADQLRRLRRVSLLTPRWLPRDLPTELS
jgi:hypothetical protein